MKNRKFYVWFSASLVIYLLISLFQFSYMYNNAKETLMRYHDNELNKRAEYLNTQFDTDRNRVLFLGNVPPINGIIRATQNQGIDPLDGTTTDKWKQRLETIFYAYIQSNPTIRQIRYIGLANNGRELVRVQRNHGSIEIVHSSQLQEKSERAYFQDADQLHLGSLYISPIELNREYGAIEFPAWPTYRIAIASYNADLSNFGFVIINIDASKLLNGIDQDAK